MMGGRSLRQIGEIIYGTGVMHQEAEDPIGKKIQYEMKVIKKMSDIPKN